MRARRAAAVAPVVSIALAGGFSSCAKEEEVSAAESAVEVAASVAGSPVGDGRPAKVVALTLALGGCRQRPAATYVVSGTSLRAGVVLTQADTGCRIHPTAVTLREGGGNVIFRRAHGENATAEGTRARYVDPRGRTLLGYVAAQLQSPLRAEDRVEFLFVPLGVAAARAVEPEATLPGPSGHAPLFTIHALVRQAFAGDKAWTLFVTCDGELSGLTCAKTEADGAARTQSAADLMVAAEARPATGEDPGPSTYDEAYAKALVAPFLSRPHVRQGYGSFLAIELQDSFDVLRPGGRWRGYVLHSEGAATTFVGAIE